MRLTKLIIILNFLALNAHGMEQLKEPIRASSIKSFGDQLKAAILDNVYKATDFQKVIALSKEDNGLKSKNFYPLPDGADGYLYFSDEYNTAEKLIEHIIPLNPLRVPLKVSKYLELNIEKHSLMVGSGHLQALVQPASPAAGVSFANPYFIDANKDAFPDMVGKFGLELIENTELKKYQGKFDAVYLDFLPGIYDENILLAAQKMLKSGGGLWMTFRTGNNGLSGDDYTDEENQVFSSLSKRSYHSDYLSELEIKNEMLLGVITRKLENLNFTGVHPGSKKIQIRINNIPHLIIYAYKK